MDRPEVSLLVLAHDTPREVEALLDTIVRHTHEPYELLLIDNGSSLAGREAHTGLAARYGARLIPLDANVTFSIANNMGLRVSDGEEVVFLNSDVEVTPNWLRNLRAALHSAPDVGIVGPRTTFSQASQGGVWLDDDTPAGVERFGRFFNHPDASRWFETDWLAGFALMARRRALDVVGGFDESLPWHGLEDRALGFALRAAGWRALVAGDTFVHHTGHRTFAAAGRNRTAARTARREAPEPEGPSYGGRLVEDGQGLLFEVRAGVAYHLEILAGLIRDERRIETAADGELERLPLGSPITACRVRGTDEVWVLHGGSRRRVRGDPQRIRRLPAVWQAGSGELDRLPEGPAVRIEKALPPVPEIAPRLPANPAQIAVGQLATLDIVEAELATALDDGRGYSLIRLERDEILVLNQGMWPAPELEAAPDVRDDSAGAALALRQAIIGADAVGVLEDRSSPAGARLLAELLFHYDLYPRLWCSSQVGYGLMGLDAATGERNGAGCLPDLLGDRRVALVVPGALATEPAERRGREFDVQLTLGLDDISELDRALAALAGRRSEVDVVLAMGGVPVKALCSRLARELDLIALDVGGALEHLGRA